jgi:hypothetical protein
VPAIPSRNQRVVIGAGREQRRATKGCGGGRTDHGLRELAVSQCLEYSARGRSVTELQDQAATGLVAQHLRLGLCQVPASADQVPEKLLPPAWIGEAAQSPQLAIMAGGQHGNAGVIKVGGNAMPLLPHFHLAISVLWIRMDGEC